MANRVQARQLDKNSHDTFQNVVVFVFYVLIAFCSYSQAQNICVTLSGKTALRYNEALGCNTTFSRYRIYLVKAFHNQLAFLFIFFKSASSLPVD